MLHGMKLMRFFVELLTSKMGFLVNMIKWIQRRELVTVKDCVFPS